MTGELAFRVTPARVGDVDRAIAALAAVVLVRQQGVLFVQCPSVDATVVVSALARAGLRAEPSTLPARGHGLRAAIVSTLIPFAGSGVDVLHVRRPGLGESIDLVRAATRDILGRRRRERHERIRSLLRGDDDLLAWRRVLYADPAVFRSGSVPGARAVVFDTRATETAPERLTYAGRAEIAGWLSS